MASDTVKCKKVRETEDGTLDVDPNYRQQCIEQMRSWLTSPQVKFYPRTDDAFILKFLYGGKFDVDKTQKKLARYYDLRLRYPTWFKNRNIEDPPLDKFVQRCLLFINLEHGDKHGCPVGILDLSRLVPDDDVYILLRLALIIAETALLDSKVQEHGVVCVINSTNIPMPVLRQCNPKFWYRFVKCILIGLPIRVKGLHFINVNPAVLAVIKVFKIFLTEKLRKRVHVYGKSYDSLFDAVPHKCLPTELGGVYGTFEDNHAKVKEEIVRYKDYLLDDEKYGYVTDSIDCKNDSDSDPEITQ